MGKQTAQFCFPALALLSLVMMKCCFTSTETIGLLGTGAQDVHLDFHTVPELCKSVLQCKEVSCFYGVKKCIICKV